MKKIIGIVAVIALSVAFSAPISAQAESSTVCADQTTFVQPDSPQPYTMRWKGFARSIKVKGSVAGTFTGTCRGFLSGAVTIAVKSPGGGVLRRSRTFENLEFKNGFLDTGQRFKFHFGLIYPRPIVAGTCVTVTVRWEAWRYNDNELVPNGPAKTMRSSGCFRKT